MLASLVCWLAAPLGLFTADLWVAEAFTFLSLFVTFKNDFAGRIAPMLSDLNRSRNLTLILDHHVAEAATNPRVLNLDPDLFGLKGDRDISGSTTCYLFAKTLDASNEDLASIATVGAVGDEFFVDGCLAGENREAASEAAAQGKLEIRKQDIGERYYLNTANGAVACDELGAYLDTLGASIADLEGDEEPRKVEVDQLDILSPGSLANLGEGLLAEAGARMSTLLPRKRAVIVADAEAGYGRALLLGPDDLLYGYECGTYPDNWGPCRVARVRPEQLTDPAYYGRMSELLDEIIAARRERAGTADRGLRALRLESADLSQWEVARLQQRRGHLSGRSAGRPQATEARRNSPAGRRPGHLL